MMRKYSRILFYIFLTFCVFNIHQSNAEENSVPSISVISNQEIVENGTTGAITFTIGDAETTVEELIVTAFSSNEALIANNKESLLLGGEGANRTISVTPLTDKTGSADITVSVSDGSLAVDTTFTVIVTEAVPVNNAPSFIQGEDQIIYEDCGEIIVHNWASDISPGSESENGQEMSFEIISNTNPDLFAISPAISSLGTLSFSSAENANGTANISVVLKDDGGTAGGGDDTSETKSFTITVNSVNDPPVNTNLPSTTGVWHKGGIVTVNNGTWNDDLDGNLGILTYEYQWQRADDAEGRNLIDILGAENSDYLLTSEDNNKFIRAEIICTDSGIPDTASTIVYSTWHLVSNAIPIINQGESTTVTMDEDSNPTAFELNLDATDTDEDSLTWSIGEQAVHGIAAVSENPIGTCQKISFIPDSEYSGTDVFQVTVNDGYGGLAYITVNVTMNPINDAPIITEGDLVEVTMDEDSSPTVFDLVLNANDIDNAKEDLTWSIEAQGKHGIAAVSETPTGASQSISYVPIADYNGSDSFRVKVNDENGGEDTITVNVIVNPVNDMPTFTKGVDQTINEDAGLQNEINWATGISKGPDNESEQRLIFIVENNNKSLFCEEPRISANGTLSYSTTENASGTAIITVVLKDDGGTSIGGKDASEESSFIITVNEVNDPPVNTTQPSVTGVWHNGGNLSLDRGTWNDNADGNSDILVYEYQWQRAEDAEGSSLENIIGAENNNYTLTPEDNNKYVRVKITCTDSGIPDTASTTAYSTWQLVSNANPILNQGETTTVTMDEDSNPIAFELILNAIDSDGDSLTWSIEAQGKHGIAGVSETPTGASQSISYVPIADYNGSDSFRVKVNDENGGEDTITVNVIVNPVNDMPAFTKGVDLTINEDAGQQNVINWATGISKGPNNESEQILTFIVENNNNSLFRIQPSISADGALSYNTAENANGTATVTVYLKDNGGGETDASLCQTFTIKVNEVNDTPSFTKGVNQTVSEDAGPQNVISWATGISKGPANESEQILTFIVENNNNSLFSEQPNLSLDGTLRYTTAENANGTATVTVYIHDNGGGETDTSLSQTFMISVNAVNDAPKISDIVDFSIDEDTLAIKEFTIGDNEDAAEALTINIATDNTALIPKANILLGGSGTDRNITVTPVENQYGEATITITVKDEGNLSVSDTFLVTVNSINDAPTIESITDRIIDEDASTGLMGCIVGDVDTAIPTLTVTAISSNQELVLDEKIIFQGISSNRIFTINPEADKFGSTIITVTVNDGSLSASTTFKVTVNPLNDSPTISDILDLTINEDNSTGEILFTIDDIDSGADLLTLNASTSNTAMIPRANIILGGSGENRTISITPNPNKSGTAVINVSVKDSAGRMVSDSFRLTVNPVNDAPSFENIGNIAVNEDSGDYSRTWAININKGANDEKEQILCFNVTNENNALFAVQPSISSAGVLTFTPKANANGTAEVTVLLADNGGIVNGGVDISASQTFTVSINAVNDTPTFDTINSLTILEDANQQTVSLAGIGSGGGDDEKAQVLTVSATSDNQAIINNPTVNYESPGETGSIRFQPIADANGIVNITVTVSDGQEDNNTISRSFQVTVEPVNDPPQAADMEISINTDEDQSITGALLASDIENDELTYSIIENGILGDVTITNTSTGEFKYIPVSNSFGTDTFTFQVNDGEYNSNVATVTVIITGVNDPPSASGQSIVTNEDVSVDGMLIGNDVDSTTLTFSIVDNPTDGDIEVNAETGAFTYTPNSNFNGIDRFTFRVFDGFLFSNTATVTINVAAINDKPVALSEEISLSENQILHGILKANDIENDSLSYSIVSMPGVGTLELNNSSTGRYSYTPPINYSGDITFSFQVNDGKADSDTKMVTIHVTNINQPPIILNPPSFTVEEDDILVSNVSASDPDGDSITYSIVSTTMHGTLNLENAENGAFTYTPGTNFNGVDYFTFKATDGDLFSSIIMTTITVTPENDTPVAYGQIISTEKNSSVDFKLVGFDVEEGSFNLTNFTIVNEPSKGTVTKNENGTFTYKHTGNTTENDSFSFKVTDSGGLDSSTAVMTIRVYGDGEGGYGISGIQNLTIDEDQTASLNLTMNGFTPTTVTAISSNTWLLGNENISVTGNGVSWDLAMTPYLHHCGKTVVTVTASDGEKNVSETFILTVNRVNHTPVANSKTLNMDQDTELNEFVRGSDANGDGLTYNLVTSTSHGTLNLNNNGTFKYTPDNNYFGEENFTFTAKDYENAISEPATVTINIRKVDKAPIVTEESISTAEDVPVEGVLTGWDPHGGSITFELVDDGNYGTAIITDAENGNFIYTPNLNFNGSDIFTFKARGTESGMYSGIVAMNVTIESVNDPPVINAKTYHTDEDQMLTGFITATDIENSSIIFEKVSAPSKGTVTVEENGAFTYMPNLNENGLDSFNVKAYDGTDYSESTKIIIDIRSINDAPSVDEEAEIETDEDQTKSGSLGDFITDVDTGDSHFFELVQNGSKGTVTIDNATGYYEYSGKHNANGIDYFSFRVRDNGNLYSNIARVKVIITPVNDAPTISGLTARDINEDSSLNQFDFIVSDIEDNVVDLIVTAVSDTPSLIDNAEITTGGSGANRWIKITPLENQIGNAEITVTVADSGKDGSISGSALTASSSIAISIQEVNDTPIINGKETNNQSITETVIIDEDTSTLPIAFMVDDEESGGALEVTAISNNTGIVDSEEIVIDGAGNNRTIRVIPKPDKNGSVRVTISASDGNSVRTAYLDVVVNSVNDAPIIEPPADQNINEDTGTDIIYFTISDIDSDVEDISVSATSLDQNKVLDAGIIVEGNGAERTVKVTPIANANGNVVIRLTADDHGMVCSLGSATFNVNINPINDAPSFIGSFENHSIDEDNETGEISFNVDDIDSDVNGLILSAISSNTALVTSEGITFGGAGSDRWIKIKPEANQNGSSLINVRVSDGEKSNTTSFTLTVNPFNDAPSISAIAEQIILEEGSTNTITFTVNDIDDDVKDLVVTATSNNPDVIPVDNVILIGNGAERTVKATPLPNKNGDIILTLTVSDLEGLTSASLFKVHITPVNDAPFFTKGTDQTVNEDAGCQTVENWATDVSKGPDNENGQDITFNVQNNNNSLFNVQPQVNANGILSYTPAENAHGTALVTIYLEDNGGTNNEGIDASAEQSFTITVNEVNDTPSFTKGTNQIVNEDAGPQAVEDWASDISKGPTDEVGQNVSFEIINNTNSSLFASEPVIASNGLLSYTPAENANGLAEITVVLKDDGGIARGGEDTSAAKSFTITVNPINDPPVNTILPTISGVLHNGKTVTVNSGTWNDNADDNLGILIYEYQWQRAEDIEGSSLEDIAYAENSSYLLIQEDNNKYIRAKITCTDTGVPDTAGTIAYSAWQLVSNADPIINEGESTTVIIDEDANPTVCELVLCAIDSDSDSLTWSIEGQGEHGIATVSETPTGTSQTISYLPIADFNGSDSFRVKVNDENGGEDIITVNVTVNPVNDMPAFTKGVDQTVNEDAGPQTVVNWATGISKGPTNENGQTLNFIVKNNNTALFIEQPSISTDGVLSYTTAENAYGLAAVTVYLKDNGGGETDTSDSQIFTITVNEVNDAPSFIKGADLTVYEDAGPQTVVKWATGISKGPTNENGQTLLFTIENDNNSLFSVQPTLSLDGTLNFTPAKNANGVALITVNLRDSGGIENSGVDTFSRTFTITVDEVNDAPSFVKGSDISIGENTGTHSFNNWACDISSGPVDEDSQALTFNVSNNNNGLFSEQPVISDNGTLTFTPKADTNGLAVVTVQLQDNGGTENGGKNTSIEENFNIIVLARNQLKLRGFVENAVTGLPVVGATLNLCDLAGKVLNTTISGPEGQYCFEDITENHYIIQANHPEYSDNIRMTDISFSNSADGIINENFLMADFTLSIQADPSSILGNGSDVSELTAIIKDRNGKSINGVQLNFSAEAGNFSPGTMVVTNNEGKGTVRYCSAKLEGTNEQTIPVIVSINDPDRKLYGSTCIFVVFAPGFIEGIVTDGSENQPVQGAEVQVYKDFDNDGITDFSFTQITGSDGKYRIAIPRGDIEYEIKIKKPIRVGDNIQKMTFKQTARAGNITGGGHESFESKLTATGLLMDQKEDGSSEIITDYSNLKLEVQNTSGEPLLGLNEMIDEETGTFTAENLILGEEYKFVIKYKVGEQEIIAGETNVKLTENGELNINQILIDPYGTVTDSSSGEVISGAHVELFYADTVRNKVNGLIPGTKVPLPLLASFPPANNANPQYTDVNGKYAFMVFPNTDYYIMANKSGYKNYTSPIICVNKAIVRHDFQMVKEASSGGDSKNLVIVNPENVGINDLAISIHTQRMKVSENSSTHFLVKYINSSVATVKDISIRIQIPEGLEPESISKGIVNGKKICWKIDSLEPGVIHEKEFSLKTGELNHSESLKVIKANITSSENLVKLEDDNSDIRILIYSNRYSNIHKKYIVGYPDGEFKPQKEITRAEIAAIFSRLLGLENSIKVQKSNFSDVSTKYWAKDAIVAVNKRGLMGGYKNKLFKPAKPITRAEFAAICGKYFGIARANSVEPMEIHFTDLEESWARSTIEEIYRYNIMKGYGKGIFKPNNPVSRAEAVTIINNMLYRGPLITNESSFSDVTKAFWAFGQIEEASRTHAYQINIDSSEKIKP